MALDQVRYDADEDTYYTSAKDEDRAWANRTEIGPVGHIQDFGHASATSLKHAMRRAIEKEVYEETLFICNAPYEHFDYDHPPVENERRRQVNRAPLERSRTRCCPSRAPS